MSVSVQCQWWQISHGCHQDPGSDHWTQQHEDQGQQTWNVYYQVVFDSSNVFSTHLVSLFSLTMTTEHWGKLRLQHDQELKENIWITHHWILWFCGKEWSCIEKNNHNLLHSKVIGSNMIHYLCWCKLFPSKVAQLRYSEDKLIQGNERSGFLLNTQENNIKKVQFFPNKQLFGLFILWWQKLLKSAIPKIKLEQHDFKII